MGLEAANYISDLVETNPTGSDPASSSDDHHRLIKKVAKQTFPNLNGPVTATPAQLNSTATARVEMGTGPGQLGNVVKIGQGANGLKAAVDATDLGEFVFATQLTSLVGFFAANSIPLGWLKANGAAVSRTTYGALYARIGNLYGAGDGSTTFNLPDLRGEFLRGWDDGRGIDPGRGLASLQGSQNQSHNHGVNETPHSHGVNETPHAHSATTASAGTHAHDTAVGPNNTNRGLQDGSTSYQNTAAVSGLGPITSSSAGAHDHGVTVNTATTGITLQSSTTGITTQASGGSEARPRSIAMVACIHY